MWIVEFEIWMYVSIKTSGNLNLLFFFFFFFPKILFLLVFFKQRNQVTDGYKYLFTLCKYACYTKQNLKIVLFFF